MCIKGRSKPTRHTLAYETIEVLAGAVESVVVNTRAERRRTVLYGLVRCRVSAIDGYLFMEPAAGEDSLAGAPATEQRGRYR